VTIQVSPGAGTRAWAAEDVVPAGWDVTGVSQGGQFEAEGSRVKFGPFFDDQARTLTYAVRGAAEGSAARPIFNGIASFDGGATAIGGARVLLETDHLDADSAD